MIDDARAYMDQEQVPRARDLFLRALDVADKDGDKGSQAICLGNLGTLSDMMDDDMAVYYYKRGYDMAVREKDQTLQLKFVVCLVKKYIQNGDLQEARKWYGVQQSLPYRRNAFIHFHALYNESGLRLLENDVAAAFYALDCARRIVEDNNLGPSFQGACCMQMGDILYKKKRYREAIAEYTRGYDSIRKSGNKAQEVFACRALYVAYKQIDDTTHAAQFKNKFMIVNDSIFDTKRNVVADRLKNYEKRVNEPDFMLDQNFFLLIILILFLGVVTFFSVMHYRIIRGHERLLESTQLLKANNEGLRKREKAADKLEDFYKDLSEKKSKAAAVAVLSPDQAKALLDKIHVVMEDVNVICSENFSINALAKLVGSNVKYVSKVINDSTGKNFKTLLNEYRIREACRRLVDDTNYGHITIRAIHQDLGFRSDTSFLTAFRKVTGMNPSEYKKAHTPEAD